MPVLIEIRLDFVSAKFKEVTTSFWEVGNLKELEKQTGWDKVE